MSVAASTAITGISSRGGGSSAAWQTNEATAAASPATSALTAPWPAASEPTSTASTSPTPIRPTTRAR